ncbi:hypothetical protein SUGI_1035530 [Cryptomeria japonica]|uniref:protein CASP n=1 Tax=Cryptomeria japonica TaxID=3369 RepID=UPI0024147CDD|nr:protein CASP [Cryptomeria japonica]GLJ49086.1 hypothetical protein SUGI_1035530 [Cryptomeria japonica]
METHEETNDGLAEKVKNRGSSYSSASPIAVVLSFWKEFDLENERTKLDDQGLKIAENQETSLKNRRKLAESTRDFKKASNEEKLNLFNSLLKGYQEEVDNLTKRAKFGENAFLNIYQKLYEAPDPCPALGSTTELASKVAELESENRKMKHELEEFRAEAAHLKNQQSTVRRLEERNRQLEQQMEEKVKEIVDIKQRTLAEENQKTLEVLKEREMLLQEQLRTAKESVSNMQRLHEFGQSQLFEFRAQSDEDRAANQSELNLLTDEVERAQARLSSLEREKEQLRSQLQAVNTQETQDKEREELDTSKSLEASLSAKEKIISELHAELHKLETTLSNEREQYLDETKKLNSLLHEKVIAIENLEKELQERPTAKQVEDLRKQVKILQAVGYNSIEAEDWEVATRGEDMSKLETLLLDKNRKMEHELTQLKVKISEKTVAAEASEAKVKELGMKVDEQQKLISKLEEDILKGYSSTDRRLVKPDDWDLPELGISEILEKNEHKRVQVDEEQNSMLQVICSQRDRFRQRLREAEEDLRQAQENIKVLEAELEKSKADNVKLYEKIRYIQDYTKDWPISRAKRRADDIESGFSSDIESKYKKIYEDDINPFAAFSKKEKERRYKELGIRDKITLTSGRFLLGNKYGRTFIFFYSIGLHLLVFASLYRMSALSYQRIDKSGGLKSDNGGVKVINVTMPHST